MRLFLVRHGQTDFNRRRQSQVGANPPLNAAGILQSQQCSAFLDERLEDGHEIDALFCSILLRATETAEILMQHRPEPAVHEESTSLAEGCYVKSLEHYTEEILETCYENGYENVLIVSHSSVIKYMVRWLAHKGRLHVQSDTPLRTPRNASVSEIDVTRDGKALLVLYNALPGTPLSSVHKRPTHDGK